MIVTPKTDSVAFVARTLATSRQARWGIYDQKRSAISITILIITTVFI